MNAALPPEVAVQLQRTLVAPRRPLLTRGGWAAFTAVAYVLLVLVLLVRPTGLLGGRQT